MEQVTLILKELYDLVLTDPLSKLAKKYKISDNRLRKICKRMNIPIPAMDIGKKSGIVSELSSLNCLLNMKEKMK